MCGTVVDYLPIGATLEGPLLQRITCNFREAILGPLKPLTAHERCLHGAGVFRQPSVGHCVPPLEVSAAFMLPGPYLDHSTFDNPTTQSPSRCLASYPKGATGVCPTLDYRAPVCLSTAPHAGTKSKEVVP